MSPSTHSVSSLPVERRSMRAVEMHNFFSTEVMSNEIMPDEVSPWTTIPGSTPSCIVIAYYSGAYERRSRVLRRRSSDTISSLPISRLCSSPACRKAQVRYSNTRTRPTPDQAQQDCTLSKPVYHSRQDSNPSHPKSRRKGTSSPFVLSGRSHVLILAMRFRPFGLWFSSCFSNSKSEPKDVR